MLSPNHKKLIALLADGEFHSGTELAEKMGISRSAICKQLNVLAEIGLEYTAISGKGYRLEQPLQLLSEQHIRSHLNQDASQLIAKLEIHDSLNSTNSYLVEHSQHEVLNDNLSKGRVCFAEYQTAGKGRRGRQWVSPFGSNIYLSILWQFQNGPASISGLSLAVGVAVVEALKECGITETGLKWPNDIYWQDKKLGGILIEVSGEASGPCHAVIGLGLNFYLPEHKAQSIEQDWVDLNQILAENSAMIRNKLAAVLLNQLMPKIAFFEQGELLQMLEQWRQFDCMQGKQVNVYMGKQMYSGTVLGIDNNGLLLLQDDQGNTKTFASGEVSFRSS